MNFKSLLTSLSLILTSVLVVNAQNTISGKVTDGVESVPGANVVIQGTSSGTSTDNNGLFTLSSDQDFPWTLDFSSVGYKGVSIEVNSTSQLISIILSSGEMLDEVVIAASRKAEKISDVTASVSIISLSDIEKKSSFNATNLLDNIVGVQVDRQGANRTNITLRDRVDIFQTSALVMLDYRDLSQAGLNLFDSGNTNLSMIDLERVEVVRGPQAALYGAGVGSGVVHYMSKDPFKHEGSTIQLQGGAIANSGSLLSGGNFNMKSVYFRHAVSNDDKTFGYKFNLRYSENGTWDLNDSQKLSVFGASGTRTINDPLTGQSVGSSNQLRDIESKGVDASLYYRPNNNFSFTAVAGMGSTIGNAWTSGTGEVFGDQNSHFVQFRVKSNDLFAQYNFTKNIPGNEGDEIGFNYRTGLVSYIGSTQSQLQVQQEITLDKLNTVASLGFEHKLSTFDSYTRTHGRNENNDDYRTYGAYLSTKTNLSDNIILSLAGRYDRFAMLDESAFSPRVGLVIKADPKNIIRLSYNKSHTPPSAVDMFMDLPVADLSNLSAGLDMHLYGNGSPQTFDNVKTKFLFGGGLVPDSSGIGMSHAILYGVLAPLIAQQVNLNPLYAGLKPFLPFLTAATSPALVLGTGGYTTGVTLDQNGNSFGDLVGGDQATLQVDTTYEIGYKTQLADNLSWSLDVYQTTKENFTTQTVLSPMVALPTIGADFAGTMQPLFQAFATSLGNPAPVAAALAQNMTNLMVGAALGQGLNGVVGIVQTDQAPQDGNPHVMMGYRNFGKISYWGFDTSANWVATDDLTIYANYSVVSETEFNRGDLGDFNETASYFLNHSKHRLKTGLNYSTGQFDFGLAHKYDSGFNANMGPFYSGLVPQRNIVDFNVGLNINSNTYLDVSLYNLGGEKYSVFPGMPLIGMSGVATLKIEL